MEKLPWVKWWQPWRRCKTPYPKSEGMYKGRCELDKKHNGIMDHAIERGMDIPRWKTRIMGW